MRFPPVLIVGLVIAASLLLQWLAPAPLGAPPALGIAGAGLIATGLIVIGWAALSFHRAKTHIEPWKPTARLVSGGVFAWSRNPIYLAFCLIQAGTGLWLDTLWVVITVPLTALLLFQVAIRNEEAYLERKFGNEYQQYRASVRRWL